MWNNSDPLQQAVSEGGKSETKRSNLAFRLYAMLGPARSLDKLLASFSTDKSPIVYQVAPTKSLDTLKQWSMHFFWVARANRFDEMQRAAQVAAYEDAWRKKIMGEAEVLGRLSDMGRATHQPFIKIENGSVFFDFSKEEAKENIHLIKKIKTKRSRRMEGKGEDAQQWEDEWVEVELHDAQAALLNMGRYHKVFVDQQNVNSTVRKELDPEEKGLLEERNRSLSKLAETLGEILSGESGTEDGPMVSGE